MKVDFAIVGGGIGGLVLAELLRRKGKKVIVLEKSTASPTWTRPEILWPATVQLLFSLAPQKTWESAMHPLRGVEFFNGEKFVSPLNEQFFAEVGVQPWSTDPNLTRELLFGLSSSEVRRGVEVTEFLTEGPRIVGVRARNLKTAEPFEILADWTIGDDGAASSVRAAAGFKLAARLFPIEFLCFKCDWPQDFPARMGRAWPNRKNPKTGIVLLGTISIPGGKGAGLVGIRARQFDTLRDPAAAWAEFCSMDSRIAEVVGGRKFPDDFARVRRPWGHVASYGEAGVLLMGDAAHPVSPVGGQGANMSIADAKAIAELADHPNLAQEYERRRRPANRRSLMPTRVAASLQTPPWTLPLPLLFSLASNLGRPMLIRRTIRFMSTAFLSKT